MWSQANESGNVALEKSQWTKFGGVRDKLHHILYRINKQIKKKLPELPCGVFVNSKLTLNSPGLAFIARVFKTSSGCVMVVAIAPCCLM